MTTETVFDMASCSKAMSTAISAWMLIEQGKLRLLDRVDKYIPGFENWKDSAGNVTSIRVVDLMTHVSGLPPYADINKVKEKYGAPNRDGLIDYILHPYNIMKHNTFHLVLVKWLHSVVFPLAFVFSLSLLNQS